MIILIDLHGDKIDSLSDDLAIKFINRVVEIQTRGIHKIILARQSYSSFLAKCTTDRDRYLIENLYKEFSQTGGLLKIAPFYVSVTDIGSFFKAVGSARHIGVADFLSLGFTEHPILLVEHEVNDGEYVEFLTRYAAKASGLPIHKLELGHAGGDDMPTIVEAKLTKNKLVACIADSDRKYPGAGASGKNARIKELAQKNARLLLLAQELPCHEIENSIPFDCLDKLSLSVSQKATLRELERIDKIEENIGVPISKRFRLYFDFKLGLAKKDLQNASENLSHYLNDVLEKVNLNLNKKTLSSFGGKLPEQVSSNAICQSYLHANLRHCPYWKEIFEGLFLMTASFFISDRPLISY